MTGRIEVPAAEIGVVRVFAVDLPEDEARAFAADPTGAARALGRDALDPDHVEVFPLSNLAGLGLPGYLSEGYGVAEDTLAPDARRLRAMTGYVALVTSGAFAGKAATLDVAPPLSFVAAYAEDRPPVQFEPLPSEAAQGTLAPSAAQPGPRRRLHGGHPLVLAIGAAVLVLLFIWLGGGK